MARPILVRLFANVKARGKRTIAKAGLFTLAVTVVSYWLSYEDRIASRHESAWSTVRAAIIWTQGDVYRWGNVGQIPAIQTLTRDCDRWWRDTFFAPVFEIFFQDCIALNSVSLERMELGGLKAAGSNLSYSNFACANLAKASLRRANLTGAKFHGAYMGGIDLTGADLSEDVNLRLANMSWALFDSKTKMNLEKLKCACVYVERQSDGSEYRHIQKPDAATEKIYDVMRRLKACPSEQNTCEPDIMNSWECID